MKNEDLNSTRLASHGPTGRSEQTVPMALPRVRFSAPPYHPMHVPGPDYYPSTIINLDTHVPPYPSLVPISHSRHLHPAVAPPSDLRAVGFQPHWQFTPQLASHGYPRPPALDVAPTPPPPHVMMAYAGQAADSAARAYREESTPDPADSNGKDAQGKPHRRGYQACQNCRNRKVRCDLGSVDAPADPPCKRCLRERLDCHFASTRKKQKGNDGVARAPTTSDNTDPLLLDSSLSWSPPTHKPTNSRTSITSQPRDTFVSPQAPVPAYTRLNVNGNRPVTDVELHSQVAVATLGPPVATTSDSLMALVDAASHYENIGAGEHDSPLSDRAGRKKNIASLGYKGPEQPSGLGLTPAQQAEQEAGLKIWSQMRFVRNGWFTAWEAMQYVEYFFANLAPMTPIVFADFRSPLKHQALLMDEPILALAILAIASRHMLLTGNAAVSRGYQIHDKLWTHLRRQVERLLWAQEQFGGGFCGGGSATRIHETNTGQITWEGSLRTLGTIEALLLLTDWQPRALHFPPSDEENGLLDHNLIVGADTTPRSSANPTSQRHMRDYDNLPYASWLEPAWRSDKMSWMILGLAQSLAFELGVFDRTHSDCQHDHGPASECARKRRVRHLVLVYVAQTSGRMGIQSSLNVDDWVKDPIWDSTSRKQAIPTDIMQSYWLDIARIMNRANREIFSSHQFTKELTSSGRYKDSIATFMPLFDDWKNEFEKVKVVIHPVMQAILLMEYEYARLYINSLGLQKVVESWVEGGAAVQKTTLARIAEENKPYIDEVADAALNILDLVINGIAAQGYLRNAPVRTYLRTLSGMMFTLKRFSLGTHAGLVRKCLQTLDRVTELLSEHVVDDVHLSSSTSRLVQSIVSNVKQTMIRVQIAGTGSAGPSREQSGPPSPLTTDATHGQQAVPQQMSHAAQPTLEFYGTGPDPLAGIQARSMADLDSQTFVPPPNFGDHDLDFPMPDDVNMGGAMTEFTSGDWLALPLNNLWGSDEATVDQGFGGIGPTLGGRDLLEAITNRNWNQMQWNDDQNFGYGNI